MSSAPCESGAGAERRPPRASDITPFAPLNTKHARASGHAHAHIAGRSSTFSLSPMLLMIEGVDRELTEIGEEWDLRTRDPHLPLRHRRAPPRLGAAMTATRVVLGASPRQ